MREGRTTWNIRYVFVLVYGLLHVVSGSGSMYDPPNRAVMWKYGFSTPKNYNYMQLNCGGKKVGTYLDVNMLHFL